MARDSQAALVALNRFGFGARGGASGDFVDAASDPRGFVKAELNRTNGALLEQPVLLSTPALGKAVFDYQFETQQARNAATAAAPGAASEAPPQPPPDANAQRRNLSLSSIAKDITAREPAKEFQGTCDAGSGEHQRQRRDGAGRGDAAQSAKAAAATAQHHPEDLPRRGPGAAAARGHRRLRLRRASRGVLVQPFLHLRQQGRAGADVGGVVRTGGDQAACARAVR